MGQADGEGGGATRGEFIMRVLFISGGDYKYGAPKSMMTMIEGLREFCGVETILLTKKRNSLNDYCDQHGIENYSLWYRDIMAGSPYTNKLLTIAKHVVKYISFLWGAIVRKKVDKLPIDFTTVDIVHSNTNRQDLGAYISKKHNIRHVWHIREMGREDYNVIFYMKECIAYMNTNADVFVMISDVVKRKWESIGLDSRKIYTIYDGMETDKFFKHVAGDEKKIKIVITGHVQPNKGQLDLVKAVARLPETFKNKVQLDIIGEAYADYKRLIEIEIEKNGIRSQVRFLGYQNNINELLSQYDIGVTCSKAEGLGRCTVEYMLAGLFTIVSNTGANSELVENKITGAIYKYGDIDSLSHVILWGLEHVTERNAIAEAGYRAARMKFSKKEYAESIYELYNRLLIH